MMENQLVSWDRHRNLHFALHSAVGADLISIRLRQVIYHIQPDGKWSKFIRFLGYLQGLLFVSTPMPAVLLLS